MKESEGAEEITTFPLYPYLLQGQQALPNCKPISVGCPGEKGLIQLWVQKQMWFEDFQDGRHGGQLGYQNRTILASLSLYVAPLPPIPIWEEMLFKNFQDGLLGAILDIRMERFLQF